MQQKILGQLLRAARSAAGLTLHDVGIACGYPPETARMAVWRWEQGRTAIPADRVKKISRTLGIPIDLLLPD